MRIRKSLFIVFVIVLFGCQSKTLPIETSPAETETSVPTFLFPTASIVSEEWNLWSEGPHANTNSNASVSNTYCARCHSPLNGNPRATRDTAALVSTGEWQNISCVVCHEANGTEFLTTISWWDLETRQNQSVANGTELCEKCHRDDDEFHYQVNLGNSVHANFGCTACHDPHSATASCTRSGCHNQIRPENSLPPGTPTGGVHPNSAAFCGGANCHPAATQAALSSTSIHGAVHASVSCIACHDASGAEVGPSIDLGTWMPFQSIEKEGKQYQLPFQSHAIQRTVDCSRCHFEGNRWGLPVVTGNEFAR